MKEVPKFMPEKGGVSGRESDSAPERGERRQIFASDFVSKNLTKAEFA